MARLLFHNPTYAILDECTSAVRPPACSLMCAQYVAAMMVVLNRACAPAGITVTLTSSSDATSQPGWGGGAVLGVHAHGHHQESDSLMPQVSADGEVVLYRACMRAGITMLSIGHRPALRKFHQFIIHFDGATTAKGWRLEEVEQLEEAA